MFQLGNFLSLTTFGESHGEAIGGILSNFPAGVTIDVKKIQKELNRRKPGQSTLVSQRKEADKVEILSGIFNGKTTGHPIAFIIKNTNTLSKDYDHLEKAFRPSHADYTYQQKYGIRDHRGGGRSSARETANWVVAGAIAKQLLPFLKINAYTSSIGEISCPKQYQEMDFSQIENNPVRCPDKETALIMMDKIKEIKKEGNTIGGTVTCVIKNVPIGLGEPVFNKLHAELAKAMLSINACKGFEYGSGFSGTKMTGTQHNDLFRKDFSTISNHSGGIQGGISNGEDIYFKVAFKPVATIIQPQSSINEEGNLITLEGKGRHDPCVVPRAIPIVEALTAFVLADAWLINRGKNIRKEIVI